MAKVQCTCLQCETSFLVIPSRAAKGKVKYCSKGCRLQAENAQVECVCLRCGKTFKTFKSRTKKGGGKYCSLECAYIGQSSNPERYRQCEQCGKTFKPNGWQIRNGYGRFCSLKCFGVSRSDEIQRTCQHCGLVFTVKPFTVRHGWGKYCSAKCSSEATRGIHHRFWRGGHSKYRGENWYHQRKLAYQRDGGVCQICHHKPKMEQRKNAVHHIKRFSLFYGDYVSANDLSNLITLCAKCHMKVEHGNIAVPVHLL